MSTAETFGINSIGPEQMGLDITNHCNMRCRHCYNRSNEGGGIGLGRELSDAELYDFAKTVRKLLPVGFCFCGGEPLLRYDAIIEFIKIASNSFTKFSMVTNGYLMTLDKMRGLRDVGLNTIQVSIDGVDAATHEALRGVCGGYEKAIETLRLAKENKIPKRAVAFSPTRFNIEQFPSVTVQMKNLGVSEVRIQPLMNLGAAVKNQDIFPTEDQYHWLRGQINTLQRKGDIAIEFGDPLDHLFRCPEVLEEYFSHLVIHADGAIVLSAYIPITVGNIRHHGLRQYWDAGLWKLWGRKLFKDIAHFYMCDGDFSRVDIPVPQVFYDTPVKFDLIDDHLLDLSDKELFKLYWQRVNDANSQVVLGEESDCECFVRLRDEGADINSVYLEFGRRSVDASPLKVKRLIDALMLKYGKSCRWREYLRNHYCREKATHSFDTLNSDSLGEVLEFLSEENRRIDFKYNKPGVQSIPTSGVVLRHKMFLETNRYFAIRDEHCRICGLFSIFQGDGACSIAYAEMLYGIGLSTNELVLLVKFAAGRLGVDNVFRFTRLRFLLSKADDVLKDELVRNGFLTKGVLQGCSEGAGLEILDIEVMEGRNERLA